MHEHRGPHFGHRHHQWAWVEGTVLECRLLHPNRPAPHAKVFVIRLQPEGQPPVTVEIPLHPGDDLASTLRQPSAGEVRGFLYDVASGKVMFSPEDPRNRLSGPAMNPGIDPEIERLQQRAEGLLAAITEPDPGKRMEMLQALGDDQGPTGLPDL